MRLDNAKEFKLIKLSFFYNIKKLLLKYSATYIQA